MRKICGKETWKKFQDAIIDARVEARVQKMQKAFDERLQKKVDELMESYGNEDGADWNPQQIPRDSWVAKG